MKKKIVLVSVSITFVLLLAIQFIPINRSNPPEKAPFPTAAEVSSIFEKACYDCHSFRTKWIWNSRIAPLSWLIVHHVNEGREKLNFSQWGNLAPKKAAHLAEEIWEEVEDNEMPLFMYRLGHSEARLTEKEKMAIKEWSLHINTDEEDETRSRNMKKEDDLDEESSNYEKDAY